MYIGCKRSCRGSTVVEMNASGTETDGLLVVWTDEALHVNLWQGAK